MGWTESYSGLMDRAAEKKNGFPAAGHG